LVDEDERRLEREARSGDPAACVRFANLFEREGRRAEAAIVLRTAIDHPAAREALARHPAWSHGASDTGRSRALDVDPIAKKPHILWRKKIDGGLHELGGAPHLLASPLGVVCITRDGVSVRDAGTGLPRWERHPAPRPRRRTEKGAALRWRPRVEILGASLLVWDQTVMWRHDLATGEDQGDLSLPWASDALLDRGVLVTEEKDAIVARAVAPGAEGDVLWRAKVSTAQGRVTLGASGDKVFVRSVSGLHAFDRKTGKKRWSVPTGGGYFVADASGVVSQEGESSTLVIRGSTGDAVRRLSDYMTPLALTATHVFAQAPPSVEVSGDCIEATQMSPVAIDRGSGQSVALAFAPRPDESFPFAIARDVIHGMRYGPRGPNLAACRADASARRRARRARLHPVGDRGARSDALRLLRRRRNPRRAHGLVGSLRGRRGDPPSRA
jgi:hypothetical protein